MGLILLRAVSTDVHVDLACWVEVEYNAAIGL